MYLHYLFVENLPNVWYISFMRHGWTKLFECYKCKKKFHSGQLFETDAPDEPGETRRFCKSCAKDNQKFIYSMMIKKKIRCGRCDLEIPNPKRYQTLCEKCEESLKWLKDFNLIRKCNKCNKEFRKTSEKSNEQICLDCKREYSRNVHKKTDFIKSFLERKPKKPGLSFDELNRREEFKRAFDDKGWEHYLKGRKWDKI